MYTSLQKCEFWLEEVKLLGHVVCKEGTKVDAHKITAVMERPRPTMVVEARCFLGMAGYYQRFVQNCSKRLIIIKATKFESFNKY